MKNCENEVKHTPTPWTIEKNEVYRVFEEGRGITTALTESRGNAEFIVRAVNSHEALLEAAKDALCELDPDCKYDGANYNGEPSDKGNSRVQTTLALYKVIEQAEGR